MNQAAIKIDTSSERVVDLRSDTVTRPTQQMYEAMLSAPLGDDVYGGDPTVQELEQRTADLLGKDVGLFFPSGTQSNLAALLSHCGRGDEYITGNCYHVYIHETGGASVLGGISPWPLITDDRGGISAQAVQAAIKDDDIHHPRTRLVSLENTVSGRVIPQEDIDAIAAVARDHQLNVHMDGARLMNAAVAQNLAPEVLVKEVDSVSLCLSKGLCTPAGTVLCGSEEFIDDAKRNRKLLGGGMRQSGILAACGLVALDNHIDRLAVDHENARHLGNGLLEVDEIDVDIDAIDTNMVFIEIQPQDHQPLRAFLREKGILLGGQTARIRLVTHNDVGRQDMDYVVDQIKQYYSSL